MPYQGLIFAAVLGVGLAVAIGMFIAGTQWEQPQTYGEDTKRRRQGFNNNNRRENKTYEQPTCTICFESLQGCGEQVHTLPCMHKFHNNCIQRWFAEQTTQGGNRCPICRKPAKM